MSQGFTIAGTSLEMLGLLWAVIALGRAWKRSSGGRKLLPTMLAPFATRVRAILSALARVARGRPKAVDVNIQAPAATVGMAALAGQVTTEASAALSLDDQVQQLQQRVVHFEIKTNERLRLHDADVERLKAVAGSLGDQIEHAQLEIIESKNRLQRDDVLDALPGLALTILGVVLELAGAIAA